MNFFSGLRAAFSTQFSRTIRKTDDKTVGKSEKVLAFNRNFKEMIAWRKGREHKERIHRNKNLMHALKNNVSPQLQLANLEAFSLAKVDSSKSHQWEDLGLKPEVCRALLEGLKFKTPLASQIASVPHLVSLKPAGKILFAAQTGSGKTVAYLAPLIQRLKKEEDDLLRSSAQGSSIPNRMALLSQLRILNAPRAIILVPTHELVRQIYATAKLLAHYTKLKVETLDSLASDKEFMDILISTPRSLLRCSLENKISLLHVGSVVIDEADTLFAGEFKSEIKEVFAKVGQKASVMATSATITRSLHRSLLELFPNLEIKVGQGLHAAVDQVKQRFININAPGDAKMKECLALVSGEPSSKILIFCNKLSKAVRLHEYLCDSLDSVPILPGLFHGDLKPQQRAAIIEKFASATIKVLVCTDLAARGLDTPSVNHVINFDFPNSIQDYLHRIGRTARAGRGGKVTSLVTGKDRSLFEYIQLAVKQNRIMSEPLPTK